jgi:transposase
MRNIVKIPTSLNNNYPNLQAENLALKALVSQISNKNQKLTSLNQAQKEEIKEKETLIQSTIKTHNQELKNKDFRIAYLNKLLFGQRSEKAKYLTIDEKQLSFFDEIERHDKKEEEAAEDKLSEDVQDILKERERLKALEKESREKNPNKKKRGRKLFRDSNPNIIVERKEIDIPDADKKCSCGSCLTKIGEESSETIEHIPASIKIYEHVRFKYACKNCEENVKMAKKVDKVFDRCAASSSLLSHILVSKFEDHLPFYRQEKMFKRYNIKIGDKLMNNWFFKSAKRFAPLFILLGKELAASNYIAIDETTINTIDKSISNQSYMWVYHSKGKKEKLLYYDFCLDRSSKNPQLVLPKNYKGYIQTDGYSGYNFLNKNPKTIRLGCMAHARRKFSDIAKLIKVTTESNNNENDIIAHRVLNKIDRIYLIEKRIEIEEITDEKEIQGLRQNEAKPLLEELHNYIKKKEKVTLAGSPIHKALNYFINQYPYLKNYLEDPMLDIDNNKTENAIRPFALGRKNWMFVGDEQGGVAAGTIYSLIESAKLNNLHTEKYLKYLLDNVKDGMNEEELRRFLPNVVDGDVVAGWV